MSRFGALRRLGGKTLIEGIGVTSRHEIRRPLGPDELARLTKVCGADFTHDGDAEAFLLGFGDRANKAILPVGRFP